jgi:hypothetical protein
MEQQISPEEKDVKCKRSLSHGPPFSQATHGSQSLNLIVRWLEKE